MCTQSNSQAREIFVFFFVRCLQSTYLLHGTFSCISGKMVIPVIHWPTVDVHMTLTATWFVESPYKAFNCHATSPNNKFDDKFCGSSWL